MDSEDWRLGQGIWISEWRLEVGWDVWRPRGVKGEWECNREEMAKNVWVGGKCALVEEKTGGGFPVSNIIEER